MSAWIVSKGHIDMIVTGLLEYGVITTRRATEVGQTLWFENHKSVNYRYNEGTLPPTYVFKQNSAPNAYVLAKQIGCYDYQTCEHDTYDDSEAYKLVSTLREKVAEELPDEYWTTPQYADAPWGVA